jgi:hypothetical protein
MCTVTYIPLKGKGYILTSSRDEKVSRPVASKPKITDHSTYKLLFPGDPKGGGSWIACDNSGRTVCLYNGAFKAHKPEYPYRHSRGLIVLDYFNHDNPEVFRKTYNFLNIEPFTLIILNKNRIEELKWDGKKTYLIHHKYDEPKIWSSSTLYAPNVVKLRESWFEEWKTKSSSPDQNSIIDFHLTAGDGNKEHNVLMERKSFALRTVSITSVKLSDRIIEMKYLDLLHKYSETEQLNLI